ncbi:MAG: hypothetical protein ACTSQE_07325 [Candidatus Heimdallarchaeaceae archaeon]
MKLPQKAQEALDKVLAKNPAVLRTMEIAFLRARQEYLSDEQKKKFSSVLVKEKKVAKKSKKSVKKAK